MNTSTLTPEHSTALEYLVAARLHHSQAEIAKQLGTSERTVRRWEARESLPPPYVAAALKTLLPLQLPIESPATAFKFIDLFAGIGGIRLAFESIGGQCVFTSEWDEYAKKTYQVNFNDSHEVNGDITKIDAKTIPEYDVLLGGFPCQPFSIAGVSKKNALGRAHGFADEAQGTLFFDVARIIAETKPKAFLLENVKNLQSHDKGNTFKVIRKILEVDLKYNIFVKVIDGAHFVPQHRERIIIVGFRDPVDFDWDTVDLPAKGVHKLKEVLHKSTGEQEISTDGSKYYDHSKRKVLEKYTLTDGLWKYLQDYKLKHQAAGNGFGFGLVTSTSVTRTLSARYYKDGSEILFSQGSKKNPRRLTPRECARLMGFPDSFKIPVSDTRAYKQFGNSVIVPVMQAVARAMQPMILAAVQAGEVQKEMNRTA
jgi:DNA (cytosine-5)-methyltransferase 1